MTAAQEGVEISDFNFNHSIHARLLAGAKALEDLAEEVGDDRAAELCGCSSSHLAESLREIEENIGGDV